MKEPVDYIEKIERLGIVEGLEKQLLRLEALEKYSESCELIKQAIEKIK